MNLLDYEINDNKVRITQQWKPLRGIGRITQIGSIDVRSLAYPNFSGSSNLTILGTDTIEDIVPIIIPRDRLIPVQQTLETLSKIPVNTFETPHGTAEYILLEDMSPVIMLGSLPKESLDDLHWHLYHNRFWAQPRGPVIKFPGLALEKAIRYLRREKLLQIFFKEQGITL